MSVLLRHQLLLGLIAGLVFFTNLGGYALFDEDEPKNAVCGREMFERGDWIVPTFNAELRTDKPILIYWWMQLSFRCFGVSEFSARFGSALLAAGTVLLTYHLGRQLYSPEIGFLSGIILATSLMFTAVGRAVTPDATLIFCLTLGFTSYVWAVASRRGGFAQKGGQIPSHQWTNLVPATPWTAVPMYAAMGLAILAKGPIGVLLPCTIIGLFLLISMRRDDIAEGRLTAAEGLWWRRSIHLVSEVLQPIRILQADLAMRPLLGAFIVLVVAIPWYLIVGLRTDGAWLRGFLGDHNLMRFLEPKERHGGPIFYYLIVLFLGCFPWSGFVPFAVWHLRNRLTKGGSWGDSDRFLACWMGVWLVFFSLANTKLPSYILPMYPALALVMARYLRDWVEPTSEWSTTVFRHCCRVFGAVGVLAMAGIPIATSILVPGEEWLLVIGAVPLVGAAVAFAAAVREQRRRAIGVLSITAVLLAVLVMGVAPMRLGTYQEAPKLAEAARRISGKDRPDIGVVEGFSPNLVFYAKHPVERLEPGQAPGFFDAHPDGFIVTRADRVDSLPVDRSRLVEVCRCRRFLRQYDLVLLARSTSITQHSDLQRR